MCLWRTSSSTNKKLYSPYSQGRWITMSFNIHVITMKQLLMSNNYPQGFRLPEWWASIWFSLILAYYFSQVTKNTSAYYENSGLVPWSGVLVRFFLLRSFLQSTLAPVNGTGLQCLVEISAWDLFRYMLRGYGRVEINSGSGGSQPRRPPKNVEKFIRYSGRLWWKLWIFLACSISMIACLSINSLTTRMIARSVPYQIPLMRYVVFRTP